MPKIPTFPVLLDQAMQVSTSDLKRFGYLVDGRYKTGEIEWGRDGDRWASIRVSVNLIPAEPYVDFSYFWGRQIDYRVRLIKKPSNLGIGNIWYFVCPHTGKLCRILYKVGTHFLHREAYKGAMYQSQTFSAYWRPLKVAFLRDERPKRTHYRGKPTRRYQRWLAKLKRRGDLFINSRFMNG